MLIEGNPDAKVAKEEMSGNAYAQINIRYDGGWPRSDTE